MTLPAMPNRLNLHAVSVHLLWARTNWQNVQDEAAAGCQMANHMIQIFQKSHVVPVELLDAYLATLALA